MGSGTPQDGAPRRLFELVPALEDPTEHHLARRAASRALEERRRGAANPVDCPSGCRGTTDCLCGQQELSDDPLWIEND